MSFHIGHRDNPVDVIAPGDLDRAVLRVWHPTEGQARAGNYKMAHARLGGCLDVTIETPLDRFRSGVDPNGKPWKVQMPAHYGYVKGTLGSDGDHVDVYVGPDAHMTHVHPVWIIDQCDAHTGAYDEHKCMLGFKDRESAKNAYLAAFSDGLGHKRIGGVVRTNFADFCNWVNSPNTRIPIIMKKSASVPKPVLSYGSPTCGCNVCNGTSGGSMPDPVIKTDDTASSHGKLMAIVTKGLGRLNPTEMAEFAAEASLNVTTELGKAAQVMDTGGHGGTQYRVEDLWDGGSDQLPRIVSAHGPRSSAPPGTIATGPEQFASGEGAERMERMYSTMMTAQRGVQSATERLGQMVAGIHKSVSSLIKAAEGQQLQIEAVKSSVALIPAAPDAAAIQTMVAEAVGKSIGEEITKALAGVTAGFEKTIAKAMRSVQAKVAADGPEKEAEDEADEPEAAAKASDGEDEKKEEDDDDKDEKAASAAVLRLLAKARLKLAKARLYSAFEEDGTDAAAVAKAANHKVVAAFHIAKAESYVSSAKALRGAVGPSTEAILASIAKAKKSAGDVKMQDTWPNTNDKKPSAKSDTDTTVATTGDDVAAKAIAEAAANIQKAVNGMGVLTASVSDLMNTVAGQSRRGDGLPPVFSLAKADASSLDVKSAAITDLADKDVITMDDRDSAFELIRLAKMSGVQPEFVQAKLQRLPTAVQKIFAAAA